MSLLQLLLWCIIFGRLMADEKFSLDIPQGSLQGLKTTTSYHGIPMFSFLGIPYAKPNTGRDKFRVCILISKIKKKTIDLKFCNKKRTNN